MAFPSRRTFTDSPAPVSSVLLILIAPHWARVAVQRDPIGKSQICCPRARGHGHARALRSVADRLIAVACAMLENQNVFKPDHPRQRYAS